MVNEDFPIYNLEQLKTWGTKMLAEIQKYHNPNWRVVVERLAIIILIVSTTSFLYGGQAGRRYFLPPMSTILAM